MREPEPDERLARIVEIGAQSAPRGLAGPPAVATAARIGRLAPIISEAALATAVDPSLLMAVIDVESRGNPRALSPKGATGLMQLMPATGAEHGAADLYDARQNVMAGARHLAMLLKRFGSLPLALAAYNAGSGAVARHGGRIPPYTETQAYVPMVMERYALYDRMNLRAR